MNYGKLPVFQSKPGLFLYRPSNVTFFGKKLPHFFKHTTIIHNKEFYSDWAARIPMEMWLDRQKIKFAKQETISCIFTIGVCAPYNNKLLSPMWNQRVLLEVDKIPHIGLKNSDWYIIQAKEALFTVVDAAATPPYNSPYEKILSDTISNMCTNSADLKYLFPLPEHKKLLEMYKIPNEDISTFTVS